MPNNVTKTVVSTVPVPIHVSPPQGGIEQLAFELAQILTIVDHSDHDFPILAQVDALSQSIKRAYEAFEEASREPQSSVLPAAEWILDNYYVIEQAIQQIKMGMPDDYYWRLPKASVNGSRQMARSYILSNALVQATQSRFEAETIRDFIDSYQSILPLRIGEIWALPIMLRLCVLEMLAYSLANIRQIPFPSTYPQLVFHFDNENPVSLSDDNIVANCIISLRMLATQDWKAFFDQVSLVEQTLQKDPVGIYALMDFDTRNRYRNVVEQVAMNAPRDELQIARLAVSLAGKNTGDREGHVGYYLIGPGREQLEAECEYQIPTDQRFLRWLEKHAMLAYLGSILGLTALFVMLTVGYAIYVHGTAGQIVVALVLGLLPAYASAVYIVHWLVTRIIPPRALPKLEFQYGVPAKFSTMVVIPAIFKTNKEIQSLLDQLESHFVGNADLNIHFALLTDFMDAPKKEMPGDEQLMAYAEAGIKQLNERHRNKSYQPFLLFHRDRVWNPAEESWIGWERKRGKLEEFNRLVAGEKKTTFSLQVGDLSILPKVKFVITIDSDTILPRESARRLIGTLAHPLNRAVFASDTNEVIAGYTVLQPRLQVRPVVANQSIFTQIYSGDTTIDLYSRAVSDVYQDLFQEGNYVGKGIYDVAAFARSTRDRAPENSVLSHDLFEGLSGRAGLVTDIVLFEDYPPHYLAFANRLHRWVRGDWQLLPWLLPHVPHKSGKKILNSFNLLDRWKLFDNLRRSLVAPAIMALLVCAWFILPGSVFFWMTLALSPYILTILISLLSNLRTKREDEPPDAMSQPFRKTTLRMLFEVIFLPHIALVEVDAILTTLIRLYIIRKHLLRWTASVHVVSVFNKELKLALFWREMTVEPLSALAVTLLILILRPDSLAAAAPFLLGWMVSPYIAVRISRRVSRVSMQLSQKQEHDLRLLARSTWLFFEHFIGPEDHWLPPDHFQEDPRGLVAHRTSPTNIGLLLLSTLAAYDLGYIGAEELELRVRNAFEILGQLERNRGHFLNWYDTQSLTPLPPRYISTVDSGNLAACLLVLQQGFKDILIRPIVRWSGLVDTLDMLIDTLEEAQLENTTHELHEMIINLREQARELEKSQRYTQHFSVKMISDNQAQIEAMLLSLIENSTERLDQVTLNRLFTWVDRTRYHLDNIQRDLNTFAPWSLKMTAAPPLFEGPDLNADLAATWQELQNLFAINPALGNIPTICSHAVEVLQKMERLLPSDEAKALEWNRSFSEALASTREAVLNLLKDFQVLSNEAESFFKAMDFRFLFDPQRQVFHIGYNVDSGWLDSNHYDLLASEARISSLIAIGKGDVPQSHWLFLARPLTEVGNTRALLSWSGTMFEYLMPTLFLRSYRNTLLHQTCQAIVQRQIAYGKEKGVPWGISESGFNYLDAHQVYQYRAFGVPGLGYKRGLGDDLVIAPYASMMALPFDPQAVLQNLKYLHKFGMNGLYGLYESIDFTPERLGAGQEYAVVRSFMAHHQGMILVALNNFLSGNRMVRRFHADLRIENVELLLQEQTSQRAEIENPHLQDLGRLHPVHSFVSLDPWMVTPDAPYPRVHSLTNGRFHTLITAAGSGYNCWKDLDLTRWRADTTLDDWGTWLYVRNNESGELWSAASQPVGARPDLQRVDFFPHRVDFQRRDGDISTHTTVMIAADNDVEIRQVTLTNHSNRTCNLSVTSYGEVILAAQDVDRRHPAFNRLFIESEYIEENSILIFHRRSRSSKEKPVYLAHSVVFDNEDATITGFETDRAQFLGLGGTPHAPAALLGSQPLSRKTGATLDPIFALQTGISLAPYQNREIIYLTLASSSRKEAIELAHHYQRREHIVQALSQSAKEAEDEMMRLNLASRDLEQAQKLLSVLLYPFPILRADPATLAANSLGQPGLWPFAISGDYPILLIRIRDENGLELLDDLLKAHTYWRRRDLKVDLVILNRSATGYYDNLSEEIRHLLVRTSSEAWINKRGGVFLLREDQMAPAEAILLATAARVVLDDNAGMLGEQLAKLDAQPVRLPNFIPIREPVPSTEPIGTIKRPDDLLFDNGLGGFTPDGREYVIYLEPGRWTSAPWTNVIANPEFGFLVTSNGLGCTWAYNSGENRLTPWHNDPVSDPPSEAIYLRDEDTGQLWSPTPLPTRAEAPYRIHHGAGYSIFEHASHRLSQSVCVFAVPDKPVKIVQLRLENLTTATRRINVTYFAEWVLGTTRDISAQYVIPEFDSRNSALLARNPYNVEFAQNVAFLAASRELQWVTTDRSEFLGRLGSYAHPVALERVGLSANVQPGVDPCAVMQILLWLAPGESKEVTFLLGQGSDHKEAESLIEQYQDISHVNEAWKAVSAFWDEQLGAVQVHTPEPAIDLLLNRWLLYQAFSCRMWGRTALYQSSGAFGFRDQLQDVLAFMHARPDVTRAHILNAASHQFEEGDVLHWWHPPSGRGIRARISDNLLWLPYVTAQYVHVTGDRSILTEKIPFLSAKPLQEGEDERYDQFAYGEQQGTLYEHCLRAIKKGVTQGPHNLPLMGTGDWNDGLNSVGDQGKGESIWLGWFTFDTLMQFARICEKMDDPAQAKDLQLQAEALKEALDASAWDGNWYIRAFFDDGTALGSAERRECRIDSISQSWAVLSGAGNPEHNRTAMESLYEKLVRSEDRIILLLEPAFNLTLRDPGYIKAYPPGVRENGGQYTHAALWAIWAFTELGQAERAMDLFRLINPVLHADTPEKVAHYLVEPYVIAADVYSVPPYVGRGGWTWYTGSASWMYRLGLEAILGLHREGDTLHLRPSIPKEWPSYEISYRFGKATYRIHVENNLDKTQQGKSLTLDGNPLEADVIQLVDDGHKHDVTLVLGKVKARQ